MKALVRLLERNSDIAIVLAVLGVLVVLFVPIPRGLLDFLILTNFSFAFLVLLLTFYVARPVEFSTFPSLLLIATLFRLSLNVAATRLILSDGDAGKVIGAIGSYVVGGNYVVGLIVFLILVVVQYVVVTSGAQRVSEVAARFTLDSMPGQQMSIDADLNMGFIDQEEAQRRRRNLEKEAGFYGAMDGASKFVKGDAIAGIVILLINIVGGLIIGIMQHKMAWGQALQTYTLLTIGDGIVTQVPALVIAVGTGIIVTRSSADSNLSQEVLRQITASPKTLVLVALAIAVLSLLPGMPAVPAIGLLLGMTVVGWIVVRRKAEQPERTQVTDLSADEGAPGKNSASADGYEDLRVQPIEIFIGARWSTYSEGPHSVFLERVASFRRQYAQDFGFVLPTVRFRSAPRLLPTHYEIHLDGALAARGESRDDALLAIHPSGDVRTVKGEPTKDPTYGLPALWIEPERREAAMAAGYTLVDGPTVLMTHLTEVLKRESPALLTRSETEKILERVRKTQPTLVEELIPVVLAAADVQKVLQNLLREKVSIRHIEAILETLVDAGRGTKDPGLLTEAVRQRLGHAICQSLAGDTLALHVMTLDPDIEGRLIQSLQTAQQSSGVPMLGLESKLMEQLLSRLVQQAERMMKSNLLPVLLCSPELRRHLRTLSARTLPHLRVLAMTEIPSSVELKAYGIVSLH